MSQEQRREEAVVLSEPLCPETLRLQTPLEPQKAAGNSVCLSIQTPLRQLRPRAQALVFADRVVWSLRVSCPRYSPPQRPLPTPAPDSRLQVYRHKAGCYKQVWVGVENYYAYERVWLKSFTESYRFRNLIFSKYSSI